ncbi:hypothetical protein HDU67_008463 [Dinochytrium kinnereticum]|nr:hypothetical protein HDU67_008463 [Dinochytrium kinnereticum]
MASKRGKASASAFPRNEAAIQAKFMDIIADFQAKFAAELAAGKHGKMGPLAEQQRHWDVHAILSHCKTQSLHLDIRRMQERLARRWIESTIPVMKAESLDSDSDGDPIASLSDAAPASPAPPSDTNFLNRSLRTIYNQQKPVQVDFGPSDVAITPAAGAAVTNRGSPMPQEDMCLGQAQEVSNSNDQDAFKPEVVVGKRRQRRQGASSESKKPKLSAEEKYPPPTAKLSDLGGIDSCIEEILQLIAMPLKHPEVYLHLGIHPPRGILLHGPPGCGKTMLANAIAGDIGVPFVNISAPSVVSGMSGESEKKIREVFEEAKEIAPCLIFIDEIDAITPKRETAQREMERRIVAQLLTCMDDLSVDMTDFKPVIVIGATNRPDSLDPALRRAGRFDREIAVGVPDEAARARILEKMCAKLRLEGNFNFQRLARLTPGYVGADLGALTAEAGMIAVRRIFKDFAVETGSDEAMDIDSSDKPPAQQIDPGKDGIITSFLSSRRKNLTEEELLPLCIQQDDFVEALTKVQPSSKREGFATVPDVSWDNVGALEGVRDELRMAIVEPVKRPEFFKRVGISKPMGVLLYGPPGCGKTLLAKAVANESCCNFISVKGPELLNKYVGESERGIRQVFARAASSSPCIIFFDELDAICPARSNDTENQSTSRLVNTLLTELDGMQGRSQVYIIAATNRPDMIDPAMLRPGRLDKTLYVDLPSGQERLEILKTITRSTPLSNVDLSRVALDPRCEGFSGADLAALVREAAVAALRATLYKSRPSEEALALIDPDHGVGSDPIWVTEEHFGIAFSRMAPSVSKRDKKRYELLRVRFSSSHGAGALGEGVGVALAPAAPLTSA